MGNSPPSVITLAFAQAVLAIFSATITSLVLLVQGTLSGGFWSSLLNSFVAGALGGLIVGAIYNTLGRFAEGSRFLAGSLTALMIILTLGLGIAVPIFTANNNGALIWKWNP